MALAFDDPFVQTLSGMRREDALYVFATTTASGAPKGRLIGEKPLAEHFLLKLKAVLRGGESHNYLRPRAPYRDFNAELATHVFYAATRDIVAQTYYKGDERLRARDYLTTELSQWLNQGFDPTIPLSLGAIRRFYSIFHMLQKRPTVELANLLHHTLLSSGHDASHKSALSALSFHGSLGLSPSKPMYEYISHHLSAACEERRIGQGDVYYAMLGLSRIDANARGTIKHHTHPPISLYSKLSSLVTLEDRFWDDRRLASLQNICSWFEGGKEYRFYTPKYDDPTDKRSKLRSLFQEAAALSPSLEVVTDLPYNPPVDFAFKRRKGIVAITFDQSSKLVGDMAGIGIHHPDGEGLFQAAVFRHSYQDVVNLHMSLRGALYKTPMALRDLMVRATQLHSDVWGVNQQLEIMPFRKWVIHPFNEDETSQPYKQEAIPR